MMIIGFVFAQVVLLLVIIGVLRKMIFSDTNSAINRLSKLDNANREREKQLMQKLAQAQKYVQEQQQKVQDEQQKIKAEARRAAGQLHEDIIAKAKQEGDEIIKKAHASRERIRTEATIEAESKMIQFCGEMIQQVLSSAIQSELNDRLVVEFIEELEKADFGKLNRDVNEVEIVSVQPIAEKRLETIRKTLETKMGRPVRVYSKANPELVGGVMMRLGSMVVDGSLAERFRESALKMKQELSWKHAEAKA
jgi:F0F1-type ATP synthase membrane subunit b/b'